MVKINIKFIQKIKPKQLILEIVKVNKIDRVNKYKKIAIS